MFARERITRGKRIVRQEPLFPGYLFLQTDTQSELLSKVRSTFGVRQLLSFAGQVMTVDKRIIEDLRQRSNSEISAPQFSAGQAVTLNSGPFQHYQAIFKEHDGCERGIILLGLLGQQNELLIDLANLQAT
jgi:transcriptional antiterminator RfaH